MFDTPAGLFAHLDLRHAFAVLAIGALASVALAGCESRSETCESSLDCYVDEQCVLQTCVPQTEPDSGDTDALDAGDAGETGTSDVDNDAPDADAADTSDADDTESDAADDHPHPIQVSAGLNHTCALLSDHTVWCWGTNDGGVLGQPEVTLRSETPVKVEGLEGALQVVSAFGQTCARFEDGSAKCLGDSLGSGLGDGTDTSSGEIAEVLIEGVHVLGESNIHHCAIAGPERVLTCWGVNDSGQTGAEADPTLTPWPVEELDGVQLVATGEEHTCVVSASEAVLCIGSNEDFQRGVDSDGELGASPNIVEGFVPGNPVVELVAGGQHTCAREADATVRCWGDNVHGQLGRGDDESPLWSAEPLEVDAGEELSGLAAGGSNTCGIAAEGYVYCWGVNQSGELGVGDTAFHTRPVLVQNLSGAIALSVGSGHSCAVTAGEEIFCWGSNEVGQLGIGTRANTLAPGVPVVATWED